MISTLYKSNHGIKEIEDPYKHPIGHISLLWNMMIDVIDNDERVEWTSHKESWKTATHKKFWQLLEQAPSYMDSQLYEYYTAKKWETRHTILSAFAGLSAVLCVSKFVYNSGYKAGDIGGYMEGANEEPIDGEEMIGK